MIPKKVELLYLYDHPEEMPWNDKSNKRNSMGCSEWWYDSFYCMTQAFSKSEVLQMTDKQVEQMLHLAEVIGEGLY